MARPAPRRSPRGVAVQAVALAAPLLLVLACTLSRPDDWTPYREYGRNSVLIDGERMTWDAAALAARDERNSGCMGCHVGVTDPHPNQELGCTTCHGGDGRATTIEDGHPEPRFPERWQSAANPERSYAWLLDEHPEYVRFVNPGDLRVAGEVCGGCHQQEVLAVSKSVMTTASHFWGAAAYCNGIVPLKRSIFGESYSREGMPQKVNNLIQDADGWRSPTAEEMARHSLSPFLVPLPAFEVAQPGNVYRVFEKGSRLGGPALGFNGAPVPLVGLPDKLEEPGRPNNRLSDRGLGTLNRVDLPLLNVHKTRLNDPFLSLMGTNDQPGDYRSSGCTACHMVYANDRSPVHSGPYAVFGNRGHGNTARQVWTKPPSSKPLAADPELDSDGRPGHPIHHRFTSAIPSSQCMVCHMHQPNSFVNTYYGFQMWSYETDGEAMWPEDEQHPGNAEWFRRIDRNPEEAAVRGKWGDPEFLAEVSSLNPLLQHTQFADYHGHGWVFRAVFKMDREGNLLDRDGNVVPYDDPQKFAGVLPELGQAPADPRTAFAPQAGKPVHLKDIHAERGMHCVDCHFGPDVHGDGMVYSEYQAAIQIQCQDCHGTADEYATLAPTGPTAQLARAQGRSPERFDAASQKTPWGPRFFQDDNGRWRQRSMLYPDVDWPLVQVKDTVTPGHSDYNAKAEYAKKQQGRDGCAAHAPEKMDCAACHTSWVTSCFGCHLPQKANWRSQQHHFEHRTLRNLASYNPQVARDDVFMLGVMPDVKRLDQDLPRVGVVRSSSAVMISSEDAQRRIIYKQQATVAANGMSSQAFNTHFAHTVRTTETRQCSDCHLAAANDNNAWLAQTYLLGTNYVNFMGMHAFVGEGGDGFEAVVVSEWDEPQAVIGSDLHRMAYPDRYRAHVDNDRQLTRAEHHSGTDIRSLELRGEYLYTASGSGGFRVYDVANVANKDFSEKLVTAPVSPLGQDTHVPSEDATAVALPFNNPISMSREWNEANREQRYEYRGRVQNMHELYRYAYVSDRVEGLIVVDVDCLADGDPQNNFLERAVTFNPDGQLAGAVHLTVAGTVCYVCCDAGVVAVSIDDPLQPRVIATVGAPPVTRPRAVAVQFRYAFVADAEGLKVLDVTWPERMRAVDGAAVAIADARDVYVARTHAYVAGGAEGLVIVKVTNPERPELAQTFTADGRIRDLHQVKVAATNDSIYAYLADGEAGLHVISLVTPGDGGRSAYGFAPPPLPKWLATYHTHGPALAVAEAMDRDRAVDESGNQVTVFGRIGGRPLTKEEMQRLYARDGALFRVDDVRPDGWTAPELAPRTGGGGR